MNSDCHLMRGKIADARFLLREVLLYMKIIFASLLNTENA